MGRKITQYPNNVSVTPDELSLLDVSEKTGLATYESRKWTLSAFKAWLNANITIPVVDGTQGEIPLFVQDDEIGSNTRFTFIDNEGTEVGFRFSDSAGNLTQAGVTYLNVETQGLASNSVARLANWSDNTNKGVLSFRKSRGTKSAPTQVLNGDILGHLIYAGQHNFGSGTTTAVIEILSKANYEVNTDLVFGFVRNALTEFNIYLAPTESFNDLPSGFANEKVFSVDGDGNVRFRFYAFPSSDGSEGNTLITNGAGQLIWGTPTASSATSMQTIGRNSTGATLRKGTIVSISGSTGNRPNFVKAQANSEATSAGTFGVIANDIPNNSDGYAITIGTIETLDTRYIAPFPFTTDTLVDGDTLYLSPTNAGFVTNVKPSAPNHLVYIGKVVRTSPTNGTIVYRIQNGYELEELHNVAISSLANNDILQYDSATQLWKNKTFSGIDGSGNTNYIGVWADTDTMSFINGASISETGSGINAYPTMTLASGAGVGSTMQQIYLGSYDSTTNSDSRSSQVNLTTKTSGVDWSHINLTYFNTTNTNPITGNALGDVNFISGSNNSSNVHGAKIIAVATQNHDNSSRGTSLIFTVAKNNTIVQFEALKLDSDGRVKISSAYKLPLTDGTNGQVLVTDGAGSVSWAEKSDKNITLERKTASYIAVASDNGKMIEMNVASANTFTINASLFSAGNQILISQYGAGQTTITAGAGVTLRSSGGKLKTSAQYSLVTIIAISSTEFYIAGDLTA